MKKKKKLLKSKKVGLLSWIGLVVSAAIVSTFTAYGFLISLNPGIPVLNSAPEEASLAMVGVALSNNIGTGQVRANEIPVELPQDVEVIQDAVQQLDQERAGFFQEHFQFLEEFEEMLTIDIVEYLNLHDNREDAFDNYVVQIADKLVDAEGRYNALIDRALFHENMLVGYQSDIKNLETTINTAYASRQGELIIDGFVRLEELNIEYQDHKNVAIFDRKLAGDYAALIQAANAKLTVITANKDALVKGVTVTLPAGTNVNQLKELEIFTTDAQ